MTEQQWEFVREWMGVASLLAWVFWAGVRTALFVVKVVTFWNRNVEPLWRAILIQLGLISKPDAPPASAPHPPLPHPPIPDKDPSRPNGPTGS